MLHLPLRFTVNEKFARKNGTCIIYLQYYHSRNRRTLLNTAFAIPPDDWVHKKGIISAHLPEQYGKARKLNDCLKNMYRVAEDLVLIALRKRIGNPGEIVKQAFKPDRQNSSCPA